MRRLNERSSRIAGVSAKLDDAVRLKAQQQRGDLHTTEKEKSDLKSIAADSASMRGRISRKM